MACKHIYATAPNRITETSFGNASVSDNKIVKRLWFGIDSCNPSDNHLQNNLDLFEWAVRNKIYPNFWGRNISGANALTKEEIEYLHSKGCKIVTYYKIDEEKKMEEQGEITAKKVILRALELGIPGDVVIFLEIDDNDDVTTDYMRGYAKALISEGYVPGFKANTDAKYGFDREFSRGMRIDNEVFKQCLIWAVTPNLTEYDRITTTHLIHPDNWMPYAPSGITRKEIAIWQYGKNCHPIYDDFDQEVTFNLNLVRNENIIIEKML